MIARLTRAFRNPKGSLRRAWQESLLRLSPLLANSAFHLQGQMDIDPRSRWHRQDFVEITGGFFPPNDKISRQIVKFDAYDLVRRDMLILLCRSIIMRNVAGDIAELGVYRGVTARLFHHYLPDRILHLFDTFAGFNADDIKSEESVTGLQATTKHFSDTDIAAVRRYIGAVNENVRFYQGHFPATITPELGEQSFALAHLDADLYEPTMAGLQFFYPRLTPGGFIIVHDFNAWRGARRAVEDFMADRLEIVVPMPDKSGSAVIAKQ